MIRSALLTVAAALTAMALVLGAALCLLLWRPTQ